MTLELFISHLIQSLQMCVEYWYPEELKLPDEYLNMGNRETLVL